MENGMPFKASISSQMVGKLYRQPSQATGCIGKTA